MRTETNSRLNQVSSRVVRLRFQSGNVEAGSGCPTRVNALIGTSHSDDTYSQLKKIEALERLPCRPDIISDLSIALDRKHRPLWKVIIQDTSFVAATVPIYMVHPKGHKIDSQELLEIALEQIDSGVGLLTIHPTANWEIIRLAEKRLVPCTSRGGMLTIKDIVARGVGSDNVYLRILPDLMRAAKRTGAAISLGATFRSANIFDSYDDAQKRELESQIRLAGEISAAGVGVVIESPGHAQPSNIFRIAQELRRAECPIMPLGPIPTDVAIGMDHVASTIGAILLGLEGCAHILAAVTREEHTGGMPSITSTLEAISAARVAAHIIDLEMLKDDREDLRIAMARANDRTCAVGKRIGECSRCGIECPLLS